MTAEGSVTVLSEVHSRNACSPIDSTRFGTVTEVSDVQSANVLSPIFVTEAGMVMLLREDQ